MPALLHKLNNHTQLLSNLDTLLGMPGGEEVALARGDDLKRASESVHDLGWLMALLASACGADGMMERRNPAGLRVLAEFLREALRRRGDDLVLPGAPLPDVAPHAAQGWQVPWAFGTLVCARLPSGAGPGIVQVTCERDEGGWTLAFSGGVAPEESPPALARLPEAEVEVDAERTLLRLPREWLTPAS